MSKAAGAVAVVFALGGGVMTALSNVLGANAETVTLALVGLALFGTGQVIGTSRTDLKFVPGFRQPVRAPNRSRKSARSALR